MLVELIVENYAVVEQARIRFHEGLNLLTGETGSGKSIVVDSLSLLLGARSSADMIRTGVDRARVSGIFSVDPRPELTLLLDEAGIEIEDGDIIVEREVASERKIARVRREPAGDNHPAEATGAFLGDIHGQNEQQQLFAPQTQRGLLDRYAHTTKVREQVSAAYLLMEGYGSRKLDELQAK